MWRVSGETFFRPPTSCIGGPCFPPLKLETLYLSDPSTVWLYLRKCPLFTRGPENNLRITHVKILNFFFSTGV